MKSEEPVIPSGIATCSSDGILNVTYLSIVQYVDAELVALSNQFLNKIRATLAANPRAAVRVVDPVTAVEYELDLRHLHTETSGAVFEAMRARLEAVASQSGMDAIIRLRGVDVFRVERCDRVPGSIGISTTDLGSADLLAAIDAYVRRLAECRDPAEVTSVGLEALEDLFGFGTSILLLADPANDSLFVVASNGYQRSGIGAEVALGRGVVGVAAQRRRPVVVPNLTRERSMAIAMRQGGGGAPTEIPCLGSPTPKASSPCRCCSAADYSACCTSTMSCPGASVSHWSSCSESSPATPRCAPRPARDGRCRPRDHATGAPLGTGCE